MWNHKKHSKEVGLFVCGEGLTQQEVMSPLLLDGLTMDYYCEGLFHATNSFDEPHLEQITAPVLFFSGLQDGIVPTSYARETVKRLANAELIVSPNAGHLFFNNEPALFYDKVKEFISTP